MGVGRFVYTPILPLMRDQAGLSSALGANLATANFIGYLLGALIGIAAPAVVRSAAALRGSLLVLVGTLALMPATHDGALWFALRLVAGAASALTFVIAVSAMLTGLRAHAHHLVGWAFGGVGAGIALSGLLVVAVQAAYTWQAAWLTCAALAAVLAALAWPMAPHRHASEHSETDRPTDRPRTHRWFIALLASYTFEGIGYIIAGTFLVAAIQEGVPGRLGGGAWIVVGLAALPSCAVWTRLARRWSRPALLLTALSIQAVGIALPAVVGGAMPALVSAVLFGATFMGVSTIALSIGTHLRVPRAVALLTAGYSAGQILGPLLAAPLLNHGYNQALLLGSVMVALAGAAAAAVCVRFPHHLAPAAPAA
ncbi:MULTISPECIES: YbfB/YjiJ family MFS transporter [unclassified Streptomyces]|uniref:YbfB/YjiJ family MFS transporter n=1 Tax=unclassified Streptomyces TaxID=2593676 RepID=UPI002DD91859|nr:MULTISPECIES: YbfB/YjiJ family MFS transporter [unclassified Streptomyces]WSA96960.1 YbfB/YjiJ family MFS transporter [Streptomyces sp. NBC_01795]WSB81388.1 YbfB/YjiJ family MFS transporter [Streptomyces sp. NBC_01775]WSS17860.1 YbfB/YjiJ family MFS transporter [Streptomyces sp. NBC_01186]WSS46606.1 YbfB/YjiJ family MFS transporter [Streptomyces sp. NBC_01187]